MEDVTRAFQQMQNQRRINIARSFGQSMAEIEKSVHAENLSEEKKEILKGLQSDNPFERYEAEQDLQKSDMSDIEKSDILDAITYDSEFKIKKSGKEIKENIQNLILPEKEAALGEVKAKADELLKLCGTAPTECVSKWRCGGIAMEIGYKVYNWDETCPKCCDEDKCVSACVAWEKVPEESPLINYAESKEQADARRRYNDNVYGICEIMTDIKACQILLKNLKDDDTVKMNPKQAVIFKFD